MEQEIQDIDVKDLDMKNIVFQIDVSEIRIVSMLVKIFQVESLFQKVAGEKFADTLDTSW